MGDFDYQCGTGTPGSSWGFSRSRSVLGQFEIGLIAPLGKMTVGINRDSLLELHRTIGEALKATDPAVLAVAEEKAEGLATEDEAAPLWDQIRDEVSRQVRQAFRERDEAQAREMVESMKRITGPFPINPKSRDGRNPDDTFEKMCAMLEEMKAIVARVEKRVEDNRPLDSWRKQAPRHPSPLMGSTDPGFYLRFKGAGFAQDANGNKVKL